MKTFRDKDGFQVVEFEFEDWKTGYFPIDIKRGKTAKYSTRKIPSESTLFRILDIDSKKETTKYFWLISDEEFEKVRKKQKEVYEFQVTLEHIKLESGFCGSWIRSENRETLLDKEIARSRRLLFTSERAKFNQPLNLELKTTASYPVLYNKVIVYGNKEYAYSLMNKPKPDNKHGLNCAKMHATHLFLKWLLEVKDRRIDPGEVYNEIASRIGKDQVEFERWKSENLESQKSEDRDEMFSQRQIVIAYAAMGVTITADNYLEILEKYSDTRSKKILDKRIFSLDKEIKVSERRVSNTRLLKDLEAAKRLVSGVKNKKAMSELDRTIQRITKEIDEKR